MKIGEYLRDLRIEHGYNQEEIAEKMGMVQKSISVHETKEALPDKLLQKYADIYNITLAELRSIEEEKFVNRAKLDVVNRIIDSLIDSHIIKDINLDQNTQDLILAAAKTVIKEKLKNRGI